MRRLQFADLSEYGYGVAILSESKYGFSCRGNVLRISLLRAGGYTALCLMRDGDLLECYCSHCSGCRPGHWRTSVLLGRHASPGSFLGVGRSSSGLLVQLAFALSVVSFNLHYPLLIIVTRIQCELYPRSSYRRPSCSPDHHSASPVHTTSSWKPSNVAKTTTSRTKPTLRSSCDCTKPSAATLAPS